MSRSTSSIRTFRPASQSSSDATPKPPAKNPKGYRRALLKGAIKRHALTIAAVVLLVGVVWLAAARLHGGNNTQAGGQYYFTEQTARLNRLMPLPQNETPTIITVKDAGQLRNQEFYRQAQNNDLVFVYKNAQRAILYRPSTNQIINVMPVKVN